MKKILALVLALMMVLSLATTVSADEVTYKLEVTGNAGHTYEVYQIFTGDLSGNVLSNIVWGNGVTAAGQTALGNAADKADSLTSENIGTFEDQINDYLTNPTMMTAGSADEDGKVTYTATGLKAGYYLVKDQDNSQEGEDGAYTAYILKIVKDTSAAAKDSVPTVDKSVTKQDQNAEDVNVGDEVTFILKATLADLTEYKTYKVVFHDTMSNGLTFKEYVSATMDDVDVKSSFTMTQDGQNLTFTCNDVKAIGANGNDVIIITYTATLNANAVVGKEGNENKVYLEYSNNPNDEGTGAPSTGNTPEDKVLVFTYELDVTKVDGENTETKLANAEFVLLNSDKTKVATVVNGKVTGWEDVPAENEAWPENTTLVSNADGKFVIAGLDAGTYYLKETKAPAGYNLLADPVKVVIAATLNTAEDQAALTALTISVDGGNAENGNLDTGIVATDVENNAGVTLPETGGMGTTMFYVIGGLLVAAAVVLLVTKKRMASAE